MQQIHPLLHEQSQKAISARLVALHDIGRFDAEAILQIKVRHVVAELLRRTSELKQDKYRLRVRSRRLMRRLSGTICAYRWRQVRVGRKLNMLDAGFRAYAFEMECVVHEAETDRLVVSCTRSISLGKFPREGSAGYQDTVPRALRYSNINNRTSPWPM